MLSEEIILKLNDAKNYYINNNDSLSYVSKKFNVSFSTLKSHLIKAGVQIRNSHTQTQSKIDQALSILTDANIEEVSDKFGIDRDVLNNYLIYEKTEAKKFAIEKAILEYVNTSKFNRSIQVISDKYGINKKTLTKYLKDRNIPTNNTTAKYVNEDIFNIIDTEEKAYWLGFMYADGYIESKSNGIGLDLSIKDLTHLQKFQKFLEYEGNISIVKASNYRHISNVNKQGEQIYMAKLLIRNSKLWEDLNKWGCVPNKSLILKFPDPEIFNNDESLILAFIRGYFDGDGSLGYYRHSQSNPNKEESLQFVGTKHFLQGVQKYLGQGFLMQKPNCNLLTYRLSYSTKKANIAAQLLYDNASIYLERKYKIYTDEFCRI